MRSTLYALVMVCVSFVSFAQAKPKLVYTPLNSAGNVPSMVAKKRGVEFQKIVDKSASTVPQKAVQKSVKTLKLPKACQTIKCGQKLAEKLSARFVLFTSLSNADDTYTVQLKLYDASANGFVSESKQNCEFCAAREVKGTFEKAWKTMIPYLSKPPAKSAAKSKASGPIKLSILTIPPNASVTVDGKLQKTKSPLDVEVKAGEHTVEVSLDGYVTAKRKIVVKNKDVKLPLIELVKTSDLAADKAPITPNKTSSIYGLSFGMLIGGSILAGTGMWLIAKDGTVTCKDGRDRRSCPEVFNTKYLGYTAGAVGGALIGASSALLLKDYLDAKAEDKESVSVLPSVGSDGVNLGVIGQF